MEPSKFLKTIYLGDRACQAIIFDGQNNRVLIQIDTISRIRNEGTWNYYTAEDIANGYIVFSGVDSIDVRMSGTIPNDYIEIDVQNATKQKSTIDSTLVHQFKIRVGSVGPDAVTKDIEIHLLAKDVFLLDPKNPGDEIRT